MSRPIPKDRQVQMILGFCDAKRIAAYYDELAYHGSERKACQAMLDRFAGPIEDAIREQEQADAYRRQLGLPERGFDHIHRRYARIQQAGENREQTDT